MAIYRFRVTFEEYDDVSRDIEIRATQTFEDLHFAIQNAIGFDASKPASFFMSDDHWKKGREISSRELAEEENDPSVAAMNKARLRDFIADPHQKILYVFDDTTQWGFHIELVKILPQEEAMANYPRCVRTSGEAPRQYAITSAAAIPVPEDFDPDNDLLEEEEEEEGEVLGVDEGELPEGEESEVAVIEAAGETEVVGEFDSDDEGIMDDEVSPEGDEF
jgi:hypothetical protein